MSASLILVKVRTQFGFRNFAELSILLFVLVITFSFYFNPALSPFAEAVFEHASRWFLNASLDLGAQIPCGSSALYRLQGVRVNSEERDLLRY